MGPTLWERWTIGFRGDHAPILILDIITSQGYDGANTMSGVDGGVQRFVKDKVAAPAPFVHCGSHNLNLVVGDAVTSSAKGEAFFSLLQGQFAFSCFKSFHILIQTKFWKILTF